MTGPLSLIFLLIGVHALCDYPLQGDFLAKGKATGFPGIPAWMLMLAHAWIHGIGVALATGSFALGAIEVVIHFAIDEMKVQNVTTFTQDQALHVLCKFLYVACLPWVGL